MTDRRFLLKVLGLSTAPRVLTALLTLVSFSVMVRAVGASAYGIIVYLGAIIAILESFVDLGVSSAAGKGIAEARVERPGTLRAEVAAWARLQTRVAIAGCVPFLAVAYLAAAWNSKMTIDGWLVVVLSLATWIAIAANFIRACLRSCLAFESLAVQDTVESVVRSATWFAVAWFVPTTMGLAVAGVVTIVVSGALGLVMLARVLRRDYPYLDRTARLAARGGLSRRAMLRDSFSFLGLRVSLRLFQGLPITAMGTLFGANIVGIVGAFARITDQVNFPFVVIGNALAVRAPEVMSKGREAIVALWDAALRFMVSSVVLGCGVFLGADVLARVLTPGSAVAGAAFAILSITVMTTAVGAIVAPMSDYVGALRRRVVVISAFVVAQLPVIWVGGKVYGELGAVAAYVFAMVLMNGAYVLIAKRVFLGRRPYALRPEVRYLAGLVAGALVLALATRTGLRGASAPLGRTIDASVIPIVVFASVVFGGVALSRTTRTAFLSRSFFDFTGGQGAAGASGESGP